MAAFGLILLAKLVNVLLPIAYKKIVDALTAHPGAVLVVPVLLILGYGIIRVVASATTELRDMIFAKVQERALRLISVQVLEHLHELSLRFHLDRQTGGLSRAIERGTEGVESLLTYLAVQYCADFPGACARHGRAVALSQLWARRLYLCCRAWLWRLYRRSDEMADEIPPRDERAGPRSQYARDRQPAQFRNRQIFRQ